MFLMRADTLLGELEHCPPEQPSLPMGSTNLLNKFFFKRIPEGRGLAKQGDSTANKREEEEGGIKSRMLFLYNENNLGQEIGSQCQQLYVIHQKHCMGFQTNLEKGSVAQLYAKF